MCAKPPIVTQSACRRCSAGAARSGILSTLHTQQLHRCSKLVPGGYCRFQLPWLGGSWGKRENVWVTSRFVSGQLPHLNAGGGGGLPAQCAHGVHSPGEGPRLWLQNVPELAIGRLNIATSGLNLAIWPSSKSVVFSIGLRTAGAPCAHHAVAHSRPSVPHSQKQNVAKGADCAAILLLRTQNSGQRSGETRKQQRLQGEGVCHTG